MKFMQENPPKNNKKLFNKIKTKKPPKKFVRLLQLHISTKKMH